MMAPRDGSGRAADMSEIIRRKMARGAASGGEGGPGADQGWRLAFARAARDTAGLMVEVARMTLHRCSLAELLELPPERGLLALLDGPQGGLGLLVLSPEVMAALIEMQTTGRVAAAPPLHRRPTRTDAAMVAATIDRAMTELEHLLAEEADLVWAGGFRYASFLEDPRPLGLLLEEQSYRVLSADLSMADGMRKGGLILALPAEGRGRLPVGQPAPAGTETAAPPGFSAALGEAVLATDCVMEAVIGRLVLPLRQVMDLQADQLLVLPKAGLDRISLESIDGRRLGRARLGQNKGMRALRLMEDQDGRASPPAGGGMPAAEPALPMAALPEALLPADDSFAGFDAGPGSAGGLLAAG